MENQENKQRVSEYVENIKGMYREMGVVTSRTCMEYDIIYVSKTLSYLSNYFEKNTL